MHHSPRSEKSSWLVTSNPMPILCCQHSVHPDHCSNEAILNDKMSLLYLRVASLQLNTECTKHLSITDELVGKNHPFLGHFWLNLVVREHHRSRPFSCLLIFIYSQIVSRRISKVINDEPILVGFSTV